METSRKNIVTAHRVEEAVKTLAENYVGVKELLPVLRFAYISIAENSATLGDMCVGSNEEIAQALYIIRLLIETMEGAEV